MKSKGKVFRIGKPKQVNFLLSRPDQLGFGDVIRLKSGQYGGVFIIFKSTSFAFMGFDSTNGCIDHRAQTNDFFVDHNAFISKLDRGAVAAYIRHNRLKIDEIAGNDFGAMGNHHIQAHYTDRELSPTDWVLNQLNKIQSDD